MKKFLAIIFFGLLVSATSANAEEAVNIKLVIKTFDSTIFDGNFSVTPCENAPSSSVFTINAWCAIEQLGLQNNWTVSSSWGQYGIFLNSINNYNGSDGKWWLWYSNSEPGPTALNQHELTNDETITLTYGISPLKITVDDNNPYINTTSTLTAFFFNDTTWAWEKSSDIFFVIDEEKNESADGTYSLWTKKNIPYKIIAKKDGFIDSEPIIITPKIQTVDLHLQIETASNTIYNNTLTVTACESYPDSGIYTINGKCAVEQSGATTNWSWWESDAFLNSINEYVNDYANNASWSWFSNLSYGQTALNKHLVRENETLLLTYNTNPLRIITPTTNTIDTTSTITLEQFGLDTSYEPTWTKAGGGSIVINDEIYYSASGTYDLFITASTTYAIYGKKGGYINSDTNTITGIAKTEDKTDDNKNDQQTGGGGGGTFTHNNLNVAQSIIFLTGKQKSDGSIGSIIYSDWAAIALAADNNNSEAANKLKQYLKTDPSPLVGMNMVSDYSRRAMALMAQGINPYNGTATDYIQKITDKYDGTQFGDVSYFNDDIFALLTLLKAGYNTNDPMIANAVKFILSKQSSAGDWGSIDLTAAAIQSLSLVNTESVLTALNNAKSFLRSTQKTTGGWTDIYSTSWTAQAIVAFGENPSTWLNNNFNSNDYLFSQQSTLDGGLNENDSEQNRIWATTQAIPAALGKSWPMILTAYTKPTSQPENSNPPNTPTTTLPQILTPTSTIISTTTIIIATNTLATLPVTPIIITATSTKIIPKKINKTIKPEIKGEKIIAPINTSAAPIIATPEPPKTKTNPIVKGLNWVWRLLKSLL